MLAGLNSATTRFDALASSRIRNMLRTGLRVFEAVSLRRGDLRLSQDHLLISGQSEAPGNKGREGPIPADLVESLADLASFRAKDCSRPCVTSPASGSWRA